MHTLSLCDAEDFVFLFGSFTLQPFIIVYVFLRDSGVSVSLGFCSAALILKPEACGTKAEGAKINGFVSSDKCIHQVKKKQSYSVTESPCVLLFKAANVLCYKCSECNARREAVVHFMEPQGITLPSRWLLTVVMCALLL